MIILLSGEFVKKIVWNNNHYIWLQESIAIYQFDNYLCFCRAQWTSKSGLWWCSSLRLWNCASICKYLYLANKQSRTNKVIRMWYHLSISDKWIEWRVGHLNWDLDLLKFSQKKWLKVLFGNWELVPCIWSLGFIIFFIIGRMYNCIMQL